MVAAEVERVVAEAESSAGTAKEAAVAEQGALDFRQYWPAAEGETGTQSSLCGTEHRARRGASGVVVAAQKAWEGARETAGMAEEGAF